jgi:two-component system, OmpR family, alkaline phosphatase synthesis response regulator PhoP
MVEMTKVLVVEDELKIARLVREYLTEAGFDVKVANNGEEALAATRGDRPDLMILDLGLPGIDGYDVTRSVRSQSAMPIIMLTARSDETDRVIGLELGADDYVVKPFSPRELVARVKAVLRRTRGDLPVEVIRSGDLEIDVPTRIVRRGGERIETTATEFDLLVKLASQPGRVFTRGQLLDALHGVSFESYERAIDAHIKNLRKKLEPNPRQPSYIITVYGVGYRFGDA